MRSGYPPSSGDVIFEPSQVVGKRLSAEKTSNHVERLGELRDPWTHRTFRYHVLCFAIHAPKGDYWAFIILHSWPAAEYFGITSRPEALPRDSCGICRQRYHDTISVDITLFGRAYSLSSVLALEVFSATHLERKVPAYAVMLLQDFGLYRIAWTKLHHYKDLNVSGSTNSLIRTPQRAPISWTLLSCSRPNFLVSRLR